MVTLAVIIAVGLGVGLLSGLVGIGGGVLIVPFLYFFYDQPEIFGVAVSPESRVVVAHGTSLFVIMPTAVRGAFAYHRSNLVQWRAVWPIAAASVVAAFIGAALAAILPPEALKTGFGALLLLSGIRLVWRSTPIELSAPPAEPRLSILRTTLTGALIGIFSALLGVGGGTVGIPLLIYLLKIDVRQVAATSIGIVGLTAAAGTVGYMLSGFGEPGLPPWSVGYVDFSAGTVMLLAAMVSVRWGAILNQRMQPRTLEILFGVLFMVVGLRLAGANLLALIVRPLNL